MNCMSDQPLERAEFVALLTDIFKQPDERYEEIFLVFDRNADGVLDGSELDFWRREWLEPVLHPVSAFIIVDVQNDFISGTLDIRNCAAGQNGEEILAPINNLLKTVKFDRVFYTLDWHPENHISFYENKDLRKFHASSPVAQNVAKLFDLVVFCGDPPIEQILWPRHCVQHTWGSELHKNLIVREDAVQITKGTNPEIDSYSAFWDNQKRSKTDLVTHLQKAGVTDVYICGLAYDFCVGSTTLDAIASGFRTILIEDCVRGVDPKGINKMRDDIVQKHGVVVKAADVQKMLDGRCRSTDLGYFLAKWIQSKM